MTVLRSPQHLRCYTGHTGAAETVEYNVVRFRVVQNIAHDGLVQHLGKLGVGVVNGIVLALDYVRGKGFAVVFIIGWFIRLLCFPFRDKSVIHGFGQAV